MKDMKLRHFVRGTADGQSVLLRAEEVLEAQRLGKPLAYTFDRGLRALST